MVTKIKFKQLIEKMKNKPAYLCLACNTAKINVGEETCANCQAWVKEVLKTIERDDYVTWPRLRVELKVGYATVIRTLDSMVKNKILLPPDENGRYIATK